MKTESAKKARARPLATPKPSRAFTIREVADRAGVSLGTVSNVLNHPDVVAKETRKRVLEVISELGYVRNASAHQLRAGRSLAVGLIVLDVTNPFFTEVARGVEDAAREAGLVVILCNSDASPGREDDYLRLLEEHRVVGVLITPTRKGRGGRVLERMVERGAHVVFLDQVASGGRVCSVAVDDVHGGRLAGEHLIERDFDQFVFINGPSTLQPCFDRREGFYAAMKAAKVAARRITEHEMTSMNIRAGEDAALLLEPTPGKRTGVFCANDVLAVGLLRGCFENGIRVPRDIAVVGYDDIVYASSASVALTSVRQPAYQIGRRGMELLLEEVRSSGVSGGHSHQNVLFKPELVVRASTADGVPTQPR